MIYELRTYRIPSDRMPDILGRFENTTFRIFQRHGIEVVGFWTRDDANELVYLCRHESRKAMQHAWDAFRADPDWMEARKQTEADGPIVDEVISHVLLPAAFSPLK